MNKKVIIAKNTTFAIESSIFLNLICKFKFKRENFMLLFSHLFKRYTKSSYGIFKFYYLEDDEKEIISLMKEKKYDYSYIDHIGELYFTDLIHDSLPDDTMRAISERENSELIKSTETENIRADIEQFFPKGNNCSSLDIPYSNYHVIRIITGGNYPNSRTDNLLNILREIGFIKNSLELYYHGALSYVFESNILVDITKVNDSGIEDDDYYPTIYTYYKKIYSIENFITENYQQIIQDSSVFRLGNIVFGFYDLGLNIMSIHEKDDLSIRKKLKEMGYFMNDHMFYEIP